MNTMLPFRPDMETSVLRREKTMTSRTKRYGRPGDVLDLPCGRKVRLLAVWKEMLAVVADVYHVQEGFATPEAFRAAWAEIHPGRGWTPDLWVWCHRFELVEVPNGQ